MCGQSGKRSVRQAANRKAASVARATVNEVHRNHQESSLQLSQHDAAFWCVPQRFVPDGQKHTAELCTLSDGGSGLRDALMAVSVCIHWYYVGGNRRQRMKCAESWKGVALDLTVTAVPAGHAAQSGKFESSSRVAS